MKILHYRAGWISEIYRPRILLLSETAAGGGIVDKENDEWNWGLMWSGIWGTNIVVLLWKALFPSRFFFFFFKWTLLENATYTFLSFPLYCFLYFFLSFIFSEIQPHFIGQCPSGTFTYTEKEGCKKWEKRYFLCFDHFTCTTQRKHLGKYYVFYSKYTFLRNCV